MSKLVEELKIEHIAINETLQEVRKLGIGTQEGQDKLMSVKYQLLAHLEKEDLHIYPLLKSKAEKDPELKQTLEFYVTNIEEISKGALDFFKKYSKKESGFEFGKDFGNLYATLSLRIAKEEAVLYEKFNELTR